MIEGFWWFVLGIPVLVLAGISILFYLTIIIIPYYFILLIAKLKPIKKFLKEFTEDNENISVNLFLFSIPFDIYFAFYLFNNYGFKWTSFSDSVFKLFDAIF